jgi:hypothetical protein
LPLHFSLFPFTFPFSFSCQRIVFFFPLKYFLS